MRTASIAVISLLCAGLALPAFADNDKNKGQSQGQGQGHSGSGKAEKGNDGRGHGGPAGDQRAATPQQQIVIVDRDRDRVRDFYRTEYAAGRCPPGLAKKNNGCLPPGQAKKNWVLGQPLPSDVVTHPIQRELWTQLTPPPPGYEYVRVNNDIVLMSTRTRVIEALLYNLGNFGG
ncbi:MAG: DUF1236 domain-containing protein [Reyranella sp.]|nr:DUF1236 domain-containing protein [Reyranella sp.]